MGLSSPVYKIYQVKINIELQDNKPHEVFKILYIIQALAMPDSMYIDHQALCLWNELNN
jgi:hypothetical protein